MDDSREHPREELHAAMICSFEAEDFSTYCLVKNVSSQGALVECPLADMDLSLEPGMAVCLSDILPGGGNLFDEREGVVVWVYRRFVGLHFVDALGDSPEELHEWLLQNRLI